MDTPKSVELELHRSGWIDWDASQGDGLCALLLLPILIVANWLIYLIVFRRGWTIRVNFVQEGGDVWAERKIRYPSKAAAIADLQQQEQLATAENRSVDFREKPLQ